MLIRQQGTAIITALFIMALVAIAATAMSVRLQIDIRRTELTTNAEKLYHLAQGTQFWAISVLFNDAANKDLKKLKKEKIDSLPQQLKNIKQGNAVISGQLTDAQARFNLNNLSQASYYQSFQRLLAAVDPQLSKQQRQQITSAISAWISSKKSPQSNTYNLYYLKQKAPYQTAHQYMASASELRLIQGVDAKLYLQLQPYVIALPGVTDININSAPAPVLMSLGFNKAEAEQIVTARKQQKGFNTLTQWQKLISQFKQENNTDMPVTLSSDYFIINVQARTQQQHLNFSSLLHRYAYRNRAKVDIVCSSTM